MTAIIVCNIMSPYRACLDAGLGDRKHLVSYSKPVHLTDSDYAPSSDYNWKLNTLFSSASDVQHNVLTDIQQNVSTIHCTTIVVK